jgi:hypothetical protein
MKSLALAALALLSVGCSYRNSTYENGDGSTVCLTTQRIEERLNDGYAGTVGGWQEEIAAGDKLYVNVIFHHAVGGCDRVEDTTCKLGFDGNNVEIEAGAVWQFRKNREQCDGPVEPLVASCQTVALEEGTWTFQYSDQDLLVDVPSSVETPCLDLTPPGGCSSVPSKTGSLMLVLLAACAVRRPRRNMSPPSVV